MTTAHFPCQNDADYIYACAVALYKSFVLVVELVPGSKGLYWRLVYSTVRHTLFSSCTHYMPRYVFVNKKNLFHNQIYVHGKADAIPLAPPFLFCYFVLFCFFLVCFSCVFFLASAVFRRSLFIQLIHSKILCDFFFVKNIYSYTRYNKYFVENFAWLFIGRLYKFIFLFNQFPNSTYSLLESSKSEVSPKQNPRLL